MSDKNNQCELVKEISEVSGSHQLGKCYCKQCGSFVNINKLTMVDSHLRVVTDCKCKESIEKYCMVCGRLDSHLSDHVNCGHALRASAPSYMDIGTPIELTVYCPVCGGLSGGPHPCTNCYTNNASVKEQMQLAQEAQSTILTTHKCMVCGEPWTDHPNGPCRLDPSTKTILCGVCFENKVDPKKELYCTSCMDKHEPLRKLKEIQESITKFCVGCGEEIGDDIISHKACHDKLIESYTKTNDSPGIKPCPTDTPAELKLV